MYSNKRKRLTLHSANINFQLNYSTIRAGTNVTENIFRLKSSIKWERSAAAQKFDVFIKRRIYNGIPVG